MVNYILKLENNKKYKISYTMIKRQDLSECREITQMEYDGFIENLSLYRLINKETR